MSDRIYNSYFQKNRKTIRPYIKNTSSFKHLVSVQGFWYSGSSAVLDILKEFNNSTMIGDFVIESDYKTTSNKGKIQEIHFLYYLYIYGLHQLSFIICNAHDFIQKDEYIKRMIKLVNMLLYDVVLDTSRSDIYTTEFLRHFNIFLTKIINLPDDYKEYENPTFTFPVVYDEKYYYDFPLVKAKDTNTPYIFYDVKIMSRQEYENIVKEFVRGFLSTIESKDYLVLDQFLLDLDNLDDVMKYCGDIKQICVYRDPRDQYMFGMGGGIFNTILTDKVTAEGWIMYLKTVKLIDNFKTPHPNRLMIRFEDLINDYENSITTICDFLGIDKSHHINKGKYFIPEVSRKNIGIYKNYHDQRVMDKIKEELGEYCYE